jgi:arsenate reductase
LKVLFLCTGNSCRSQMAEAWTRALHGGRFESYSAGTALREIDAQTVRVMAEVGVDLSGHRPKHLAELAGIPFDAVITVCDSANETCPAFPGPTQRIHVGFDDPPRLALAARDEDEAIGIYRRVRDEIRAFVGTLPQRLASRSGADGRMH